MTTDTMVTARMAKGKKDAGSEVLKSLGITASQAINEFYDYLIEQRGLPQMSAAPSARTDSVKISEAMHWLDDISLHSTNRFASMSDEDIRRERLASRGLA